MSVDELVDSLFNHDGEYSKVEEAWLSQIKEYFNLGGSITKRTSRNGWQLIHIAALNGLDRVVEWLIENGADVNAQDKQGCTPLLLAFDLDIDGAIQSGKEINFSHTKKLIDLGADQSIENNDGESLESTASAYGKKVYLIYKEELG
ncbi:ankyrin repeat domain-containing protein [Endozoicomonas sp. SM1973]|uniref:Ankyrin repeat domain-containing protein n=1 Tax=Spartinivicinus marinus TaxID=2994442 RepID=A0A853HU00_9GAMM|nr:ankyrin repeat domain-containing protein [Spartinivicinus marinus]MCX4030003.1 ankyrin repeat domain-containing protein [Spartinivicinus marinus]NYZ64753.1 ankyrin repeat domain-containing protein [Spartinivicinus marinus]